MANPQAENGHVDIANEIMDALARTRIPGEARQVLDFIYRKTYGWHKKEDAISLSQFSEGTKLSKVHTCRAVKTLLKMNLITQKGNKMTQTYAIIKDFDVWKPLPKKVTLPRKVISITQKGNKLLPNRDTTKENITKEKKEIVLTSIKNTPIKPKSVVKVRVKQPPDPRIQVIIDYFHDTHLSKTGKKPLFLDKDFPLVKSMLRVASAEDIKKYIDKFFLDQEKFLCDKGKSLNTFCVFAFSRYHSNVGPKKDGDY